MAGSSAPLRRLGAELRRLRDAAGRTQVDVGEALGRYFADPTADPPLGAFDSPLGGYVISDPGDAASMIHMFDDLRESALEPAESTELLAAILDEYRRKGGTDA